MKTLSFNFKNISKKIIVFIKNVQKTNTLQYNKIKVLILYILFLKMIIQYVSVTISFSSFHWKMVLTIVVLLLSRELTASLLFVTVKLNTQKLISIFYFNLTFRLKKSLNPSVKNINGNSRERKRGGGEEG